jgi:hypothetical protein
LEVSVHDQVALLLLACVKIVYHGEESMVELSYLPHGREGGERGRGRTKLPLSHLRKPFPVTFDLHSERY